MSNCVDRTDAAIRFLFESSVVRSVLSARWCSVEQSRIDENVYVCPHQSSAPANLNTGVVDDDVT